MNVVGSFSLHELYSVFDKQFVVHAATDDRFDPIVVFVFRTRPSGRALSDPRNICR